MSTFTKFSIGDIHGEMVKLHDLVKKCLIFSEQNGTFPHLIFLGDFVDRGQKSKEVLLYLQNLQLCHSQARFTFLRGNHDQMMINAIMQHQEVKLWLANGAKDTLKSYGHEKWPIYAWMQDPILIAHAIWLNTLPLTFEDEWRFFVHAGIRPGVLLAKQDPDDFLWIRDVFLDSNLQHPKLIVHGHTPVKGFRADVRSNRVNVDTGACTLYGKLTAAVFNDKQAAPIDILSVGGPTLRIGNRLLNA